jgi:exonuclease SbcC
MRSPEQERPKARGEGTTTQQPKATLWRRTGAAADQEGEVLATQPSKVTAEIERLLGFRSDQFTRVVMLPQGKFRQLLQADSKEREAILERLFQTEVYRRIEDSLKERARAAKQALEEVEASRRHHLDDAGVEDEATLAPLRQDRAADCARIAGDLDALRTERAAADAELTAARTRAALVQERVDAERRLAALEQQAPATAQQALCVERARAALPIVEADRASALRKQELDEARAGKAAREQALAKAVQATSDAAAAFAREEATGPEREAAAREITSLENMNGAVVSLADARAKGGAWAARANATQASLDREREVSAKLEADIESTRLSSEQAAVLAGTRDQSRSLVDAAMRALDQAAAAEQTRKELARAERLFESSAAAREIAETNVARAEAARDKVQADWVAGQAGRLAKALIDDEPCPVCGSIEHPSPARSKRRITEHEDVQAAQEALKAAQGALADAKSEESAARAQAQELKKSVAALTKGAAKAGDAKALKKALKAAQDHAQAAEAAAQQARDLGATLITLRDDFAAKKVALDAAVEALQGFQRHEAAEAARVAELEGQVPGHLRSPAALDAAVVDARRGLDGLKAALETTRARAVAAAQAHATAVEALSAVTLAVERAGMQAASASEALAEKIAAAGFASEDAYRTARLEPAAIDTLAAEVERFTTSLGAARERAARAIQASPSVAVPDVAAIDARVQLLDASVGRKAHEQGEAAERLRRVDAIVAALQELAVRRQQAEADFRCVVHVSDVVNGQNPHGITLHRYVLGALLDDVLVAASLRLRAMTSGRFDLERERVRGDARRAAGLDLVVHDADTGTARPVNTLSGGEGFLASLALALGLADVVQAYAAGIRLETIFVDEGFGSLDEEALDKALETLMKLGEGGRLVGIISHVPELRTRIDARLEVVPSASGKGSTARIVV